MNIFRVTEKTDDDWSVTYVVAMTMEDVVHLINTNNVTCIDKINCDNESIIIDD